MKNYIVRKILGDLQLEAINQILLTCEWQDGLKTTTNSSHMVKKNFESFNSDLSEIIMTSIDKDLSFHSYVVPKRSNQVILSKMSEGCYYKVHHDSPENGNFSTTVFLNNADEYGGGELVLYLDGKEVEFKLDAGYAITYPTGILHKVNEVQWGNRIVSVFWTHTYIKDDFIRDIYGELYDLRLLVEKTIPSTIDDKDSMLENYYNDPIFKFKSITDKILRKYL